MLQGTVRWRGRTGRVIGTVAALAMMVGVSVSAQAVAPSPTFDDPTTMVVEDNSAAQEDAAQSGEIPQSADREDEALPKLGGTGQVSSRVGPTTRDGNSWRQGMPTNVDPPVWFGTWVPYQGGSQVENGYCIDASAANPHGAVYADYSIGASDALTSANRPTEVKLTIAQAAWLLNKYRFADSFNDNNLEAAAMGYLMHLNFERGGGDVQARVNSIYFGIKNSRSDIYNRAVQMVAESKSFGPVSWSYGEIVGASDKRSGTFDKIFALDDNGNYVAGLSVTLTISDSSTAVWDSNNAKVRTVTTINGRLNGIGWHAVGPGEFHVTPTFTNPGRAQLAIGTPRDAGRQDVVVPRPFGDSFERTGTSNTFEVEYGFQPTVSSQVTGKYIGANGVFNDTITVGLDTSGEGATAWLRQNNTPVPVKVRTYIYHTGYTQGAVSTAKPNPATAVGFVDTEFTATGSKAITFQTDGKAGYYTAQSIIAKDLQTTAVAPLILADAWYDFGLEAETQVKTLTPTITTKADDRVVTRGVATADAVTVHLAAGESWPVGLKVTAKGTLYGPLAAIPAISANAPPAAPAVLTRTVEFTANNQTIDVPWTPTLNGIYTWQWEIPQAAQPDPDMVSASFKDQYGLVVETSVVPLTPRITTKADDRVVTRGDVTADAVTISLGAGETWPTGMTIAAKGTRYGPMLTKPTTSATVPAGTPVAGTASLNFTANNQTLKSSWTAGAGGYYTWVWEIPQADQTVPELISASFRDQYGLADETTVVALSPRVTTLADDKIVKQGATTADAVTVSLASGEAWPAGMTVKAEGTRYGPLLTPPTTSTTVPAGTPVAGTAALTFTANNQTKKASWTAGPGGYYTWVWKIPASQDDPELVTTGFTDQYGLAAETTLVQITPKIATKADHRELKAGTATADAVTISLEPGQTWTPGMTIIAKGTRYGPFLTEPATGTVPTGAPVAGTATLTFTANNQTLKSAWTADKMGYYTWVWAIDKNAANQTHGAMIEKSFTDQFGLVAETTISQVTPKVTTKASDKLVVPDQATSDNVTVSLASGENWMPGFTVVAKGTRYGPFDVPQKQSATVPAGAPVDGTATLTFTANNQTLKADWTPSKVGFYTWVWEIPKTAQPNPALITQSFKDDFMIHAETTSVRVPFLYHWSMSREYNVVETGRAFDSLEIQKFQETHGDFKGDDYWAGDLGTAKVTVWKAAKDTVWTKETTKVPSTAVKHWEGTVDAKNGRYDVGYEEEDPITAFDKGHDYVFVYCFAGDDRVAPFCSNWNDLRERFHVPDGGTTSEPPSVVTQAMKSVLVGQPFKDTALVTGTVKPGSTLTFQAFGPLAEGEKPVCKDPFFTTEPMTISKAGLYESPTTKVMTAGNVYWVETLKDATGTIIHQGECGLANETTTVHPYGPKIVTTAKTSATSDKEILPGVEIWDDLEASWTIPTVPGMPAPEGIEKDPSLVAWPFPVGTITTVDLYYAPIGQPLVCKDPIWTDTIKQVEGQSKYSTKKYKTDATKGGTYGFVETTRDPEGKILTIGECGDPRETVEVKVPYTPEIKTTARTSAKDGKKPQVGDDIWDDLKASWSLPEGVPVGSGAVKPWPFPVGSITTVDLYYAEPGKQLVCTSSIWVDEVKLVEGTVDYSTKKYKPTKPGTYGFVETTRNPIGEIITEGKCGDKDETVTIEAKADDSDGAGKSLAATGGTALSIAAIALAALIIGGGALWLRKRKDNEANL